MPSQQEMDVVEVNRNLLRELEAMGFPTARAVWALHHTGNNGLEDAIDWIMDHENDPDIEQMPVIALNIDIESPETIDPPKEHQTEAQTLEPIDTAAEQTRAQELRDEARRQKQEAEKKLEWEREKERTRAGKEMLEAKRVGEDNERKKYVALKKAQKEEENRVRENIRQKIQADKAERRRMLGLPPASQTVVKPPRRAVAERKNYVPVASTAKTEELRECLRSLRRNHLDNDAAVKRAFQTLLIYVGNVVKNPDVEKFRKIRIGNPLFQERVGRLKGGIEFLELCGFERIQGDRFLFLPRDKVDMALVDSAGSELKSAITNPFFGLLSFGLSGRWESSGLANELETR